MIVQIYSVTSAEQALQLADLGVDHIGFVAGVYGEVPSELPFERAREVADALRGRAASSALTMSADVAEILRMAAAVRPDIVHVSTDTDVLGVPALRQLRAALPPEVRLMKAVQVDGPASVAPALAFAPVADIILLDTKVAGLPGVGATGVTHDWQISRQIVEQVGERARVILAGGLTPANVAAAIRTARPWGVDSFSGTNAPATRTKDLALVRQFVAEARRA
ncbi:MAG TPA: phosphoribosylanthranilate isomerase [Thermomicrobiales bacterium]|nr:phosphoribosylanthranilate isomerase [Thermomicrobiales bacterium]